MIYISLLWLNFDGFIIYVRIVFASYMCHQVFVTFDIPLQLLDHPPL